MSAEVHDSMIAASRRIVESDAYAERVYAGLLGKVIGVYLGRPFENWTYEKIAEVLGDVSYYVHDKLDVPLIVTDDDIAGTVTFLRAARDSGHGYDTTAGDVADAWLNYLIEDRSVLWWGGLGNSTEHTAYLRLKEGYRPPASGSAALNGKTVAEQIGSQIFIDGWAMIAPGSPDLAAELAARAASVSHDGEAIYGARVMAALESAAFLTADIDELLDTALQQIPSSSVIATMIGEIRKWHHTEPDWRVARERLAREYGYEIYGGNCHIVPNHGLIILALLYGGGEFTRSLEIVNTAGWDTDCNSGNLGCLLGLMHGLDGIDGVDGGPDWRGPVADRIYVPTADAGSGITDVVTEAGRIINTARAALGLDEWKPKEGARFHFSFPGSVQGFTAGPGLLHNVPHAHSRERGLVIDSETARDVSTATFIPPDAVGMAGYPLDVSPTLYSGQVVRMEFEAEPSARGAAVTPYIRHYDGRDLLQRKNGPSVDVVPGRNRLSWTIPDVDGQPIAELGLSLESPEPAARIVLDLVDWSGPANVTFHRPSDGGAMWRRSWVHNMHDPVQEPPESYRLIADTSDRRLTITGSPDWADYSVEADFVPHMAEAMGIAARVQGLQRYYLLRGTSAGELQLIKRDRVDQVLAAAALPWALEKPVTLGLHVEGHVIRASVDGTEVLSVVDVSPRLERGGIALSCEGGRVGCLEVRVRPLG